MKIIELNVISNKCDHGELLKNHLMLENK